MFYGNTVQQTRQMFFTSWHKYNQNVILSPLEQQIVHVILDHPEYHSLLSSDSASKNYSDAANPFLHMGLHLAVREQVTTDRPVGIQAQFYRLMKNHQNTLHVEHLMMELLAECLWQSQKNNTPPDQVYYLNHVAKL